jgi:hypothetical protein
VCHQGHHRTRTELAGVVDDGARPIFAGTRWRGVRALLKLKLKINK